MCAILSYQGVLICLRSSGATYWRHLLPCHALLQYCVHEFILARIEFPDDMILLCCDNVA